MGQVEDFFDSLDRVDTDFKKKTLKKIKNEWGFSSITLKAWLTKYYPMDLERNYTKQYGLNADLFLPYRKNVLWSGSMALSRLKLAIETKAYIIFNNVSELEDEELTYRLECLRLWLRVNSVKVKYTLEQFTKLTNDARTKALTEPERLYEYLIEKQSNFKYKKTLYHYTREDFDTVMPTDTLKKAYNFWITTRFPNLLKYYKEKRIQEFKVYCLTHTMSEEYKATRYNKLMDELNALQIKEPSIRAFAKMLKKFEITYKKQQK